MASAKGKGKGKRRGDPPGDGTARWGRPPAQRKPLRVGWSRERYADNAKTSPFVAVKRSTSRSIAVTTPCGPSSSSPTCRMRGGRACRVGAPAPAELVAVHEVQRPIPSDYFHVRFVDVKRGLVVLRHEIRTQTRRRGFDPHRVIRHRQPDSVQSSIGIWLIA